MASDDSNLIWSTATCGELLQRINEKCIDHMRRDDLVKAAYYARLSDSIQNAIKDVGLDKEAVQ